MQIDIRGMEVERINNLVRGFDWEKVEEKVEGNVIFVTFRKEIPAELVTAAEEVPPVIAGPT